jgi:hypothetical protein
MWWWHKIRRADIPADVRLAFEETGPFAMSAELGADYPPAKAILRDKVSIRLVPRVRRYGGA